MASVSGRTRSGRECWNLWPVVRTVHTHTRGFFLLLLLSHIDSDLFFLVFLAVVVVVVNRLLSIDLAFSLSMCHNYNRSSSSQSQSTLARKIKEVATDWRHRSKSLFYPPTKKKFPMTKSLKKKIWNDSERNGVFYLPILIFGVYGNFRWETENSGRGYSDVRFQYCCEMNWEREREDRGGE
jgi:hypothetical protein